MAVFKSWTIRRPEHIEGIRIGSKCYESVTEILNFDKLLKIRKLTDFQNTYIMVIIMNIKKIITRMVEFGLPISVIAKGVNKSHSTISKWLKNQTEISYRLEKELENFIEQKKQEWNNIFLL